MSYLTESVTQIKDTVNSQTTCKIAIKLMHLQEIVKYWHTVWNCNFEYSGNYLTPCSRVLLDEKLTITKLVKKFPDCYETQMSVPFSQEPATGPLTW